jgi:hypothetical protein
MALSLQTFTSLVQNAAAAAQSACSALLDFSTGSISLALTEASASVGLWLQWLIILVLQTTRLATSSGTAVDTWVADFSLARQQATYASGPVVFSRFTNTSAAQIAPGAQVKTLDGTQTFTVIADTTQSIWNATLGVYVIPSGQTSGTVTVVAVNAGTQGNVLAGTIGLLASAIPYVDTVANTVPFVNGLNAQTDAQLQAAFANYIQTRSRATPNSILYAAESVAQNITAMVQDNTNTAGAYQPGFFTVTVNDGSGAPPSSTLTAVSVAVSAYRAVGSTWGVIAPPLTTANVALTITTNPTGNKPALLVPVQNAILAYIAGLTFGQALPLTRIAAIAYGVDPSIVDVTAITINSAASDLTPAANGLVRAGTVAAS